VTASHSQLLDITRSKVFQILGTEVWKASEVKLSLWRKSVTKLPTFGSRAFPVAAARTWNALLDNVISSVHSFQLKTFLFRRSF